jgi:NitT/TauT family transport system substrate-binding protein
MNLARKSLITSALAALVTSPALNRFAPAGAQGDQVIHVGVAGFEANAGAFYALENGFFKQVGLNVDVQTFAPGAIPGGVAGGSLQIGVQNPLSMVTGREKGLDFVIIAPGSLYEAPGLWPNLVIAPNAKFSNGKDFEGKTIAITTLQGIERISTLWWIDKNGGDSRLVKLIEVPPTLQAAAVSSGRVAGAILADPALTNAITSGQVRGFARVYGAIGDHFFLSAWFANRSWADKNPEVVRRFRIAIDRAGEWATRNPVAAAGILHKYLGLTIERTHEVHAKSLDRSMLQPIIDGAVKYGLLAQPMDARDMFWTAPHS